MDPPANANHPRANNPQMAARKAFPSDTKLVTLGGSRNFSNFVALTVPPTGGRSGRKVISGGMQRYRKKYPADRPACGLWPR